MTAVSGVPALSGAVLANLLWGLSPLYYSMLGAVSPPVLLCLQVVLTFVVLAALQGVRRHELTRLTVRRMAPTALLIGLNWAAYVAAVMQGLALQASYAYLIAPILTVGMAAAVFREPMPARQRLGLGISLGAVALDIVFTGEVPYLGLLIALPFAAYVVLHKKLGAQQAAAEVQACSPLTALKLETMLLTPLAMLALALIAWFELPHASALAGQTMALLALIGVVTALPLLLFIRAAPGLSAVQLGACQFIAPITSAVLSYYAFGAEIGPARLAVLVLLSAGMACAVLPPRRSHSLLQRPLRAGS